MKISRGGDATRIPVAKGKDALSLHKHRKMDVWGSVRALLTAGGGENLAKNRHPPKLCVDFDGGPGGGSVLTRYV